MLGKLLKYEMRSTSRFMWFIYGAVIIVGAIIGIAVRIQTNSASFDMDHLYFESANAAANVFISVFLILYGVLLLTMAVMTIIMIIMRFNSNLLKGEGYLMHTLPVPTWSLVLSKTIIAIIWMVIATAVALVSGFLLALTSGLMGYILEQQGMVAIIKEIFSVFGDRTGLFIAATIVSAIMIVLQFYFSMAVGNLANKNKMLLAVVAFIGACIVTSIVTSISGNTVFTMASSVYSGFRDLLIRSIIVDAVFAAAFFFGTTLILKKRLNLA